VERLNQISKWVKTKGPQYASFYLQNIKFLMMSDMCGVSEYCALSGLDRDVLFSQGFALG